jgi:hypothetical protein
MSPAGGVSLSTANWIATDGRTDELFRRQRAELSAGETMVERVSVLIKNK